MSVTYFMQGSATPTIPGGVVNRPKISFKVDDNSLNHHYNATMRQVQAGMGQDPNPSNGTKDSVPGALNTTALTPSVAGFDTVPNNPFLRPDTLQGALTSITGEASAQQVSWLQKAELLKAAEAKDTISAAGPDALGHMDKISVQGNPYFINGTAQDTIRAVGVTVSGGATPFSDTISGTFHGAEHGETAPLTPYAPLPLKDSSGNPLYPKDGILPESTVKDSGPVDSDKGALLDPHHKTDGKSSLVDILHQLDHQVTIDLGKSSGVLSAEEVSKMDAFNPDILKKTSAHTTEDVFGGAKTDDSLITLLDEEQKKRMAANINLGPFGSGGH